MLRCDIWTSAGLDNPHGREACRGPGQLILPGASLKPASA
jgi:hypothetical protein